MLPGWGAQLECLNEWLCACVCVCMLPMWIWCPQQETCDPSNEQRQIKSLWCLLPPSQTLACLQLSLPPHLCAPFATMRYFLVCSTASPLKIQDQTHTCILSKSFMKSYFGASSSPHSAGYPKDSRSNQSHERECCCSWNEYHHQVRRLQACVHHTFWWYAV